MNECCQQKENLKVIEKTVDKEVKQCQVCGCRHFELSVDPVKIGVTFK